MKFMKFSNQWKLITVDHNILPTAIKNTKKQLFKNKYLAAAFCMLGTLIPGAVWSADVRRD